MKKPNSPQKRPLQKTAKSGSAGEVVGRTGVVFGGVAENIRSKLPFYPSDFRDGFRVKVLSSVLFMFFACIAPAVAFGGLIAQMTNGAIGAVEMLVSTAFCGVVYALLAGQPLVILGSTGPVVIFIALLFDLCQRLSLPFMPTLSWVGLWTAAILIVLAATEASRLITWFTRFTDEIFAALISLIFIYEALSDTLGGLGDPSMPKESALLGVVLALGTYILATQISELRRTPFLNPASRNLLSDFGPTIAIVVMTLAAAAMQPVTVPTLPVPSEFGTTSGRAWLVDLNVAPLWVKLGACVPALLVSVLLFLDQNITARLINNPRHSLKKGFGYHLDLLIIGVLVGVCALFGLPWMVAATVRSLNHVRSLSTVKSMAGEDKIESVVENRVSALAIHAAIGVSILFLNQLKTVPMPVLFGLFLFMGVSSMGGNQLFERMKLWFTNPEQFPETYYLRSIPRGVVHLFTAIQVVLLACLWFLKTSSLGILFPLLIAFLVPVRLLLDRFFDPGHLAKLDAEEGPESEQDATLGP